MVKNVVILFLVIYPLYVLFSRQPDYFDGEYSRAIIHYAVDSANGQKVPIADYSIKRHNYRIQAGYPFASFAEGDTVKIIYETAYPENASVYRVWGYWIRWKELFSILLLFVFMYLLAVSITSHPTPESLLEELEGGKPTPKKRRYDN